MNLNELRDEAYRIACEHGFHEEEHRDEHWLMLVITEISEAVDADRKGRRANHEDFAKAMVDEAGFPPEAKKTLFQMNFAKYIKGSVEEELADAVIRLLDFAGLKKVDLSKIGKRDVRWETFTEQCFEVSEMICLSPYEGVPFTESIKHAIALLFSMAENMGVDLLSYVRMKMKYNSMREYKHGKKY